jgi:hypothetical protein
MLHMKPEEWLIQNDTLLTRNKNGSIMGLCALMSGARNMESHGLSMMLNVLEVKESARYVRSRLVQLVTQAQTRLLLTMIT